MKLNKIGTLLGSGLVAAGFAVGSFGAATAHAESSSDKFDSCLAEQHANGNYDDITFETCCVLAGGHMEPIDIGGGIKKDACIVSTKDTAEDASGRPPVHKPPLLSGIDLQQVQVAESTPTTPQRPGVSGTRKIDQAITSPVG